MKKLRFVTMLSVLLMCLLLFSSTPAFAADSFDYSDLDCSTYVNNKEKADYINRAMKYYIETWGSLKKCLNEGKCAFFFFEGGSDNATDGKTVRTATQTLVVKNVDGKLKIIADDNNSSTIPDRPKDNYAIVCDGLYKVKTVNHKSDYAAFQITTDGLSVCECAVYMQNNGANYTVHSVAGINVHGRYGTGCNYVSYNNSEGCINVGATYCKFASFIESVTGWSKRGSDRGKPAPFESTGTYYGYAVIDRKLYKTELTDLLNGNTVAVDKILHERSVDIPVCNHSSYDQFGYCTNCTAIKDFATAEYKWKTMDAYATTKLQKQKTSITVRETPYEGSKSVTVLDSRKTVHVTGSLENTYGNTWYKVEYDTYKGYIYSGELTILSDSSKVPNQWSCIVSSPAAGTTITAGKALPVIGTISNSVSTITELQLKVCRASDGAEILVSKKINPGVQTFSLKGSEIDKTLTFQNLPAGNYYIDITAKAQNGSTRGVCLGSFTATKPNVPVCATPVIGDPVNVIGGKQVSITCATGGAQIYYTVDGTTPTTSSTLYTGNILLSESATLRAIAVCSGYQASGLSSTKTIAVSQLATPGFTTSNTAAGTRVVISNQQQATIYYSLNNGSNRKYTAPFVLTEDTTVRAYAEKTGYVSSNAGLVNVKASVPEAPSVWGVTENVAAGDNVTIAWREIPNAASYNVYVTHAGSTDKINVGKNLSYSLPAEEGTYSISVSAENGVGEGARSSAITFVGHAPGTVTFVDYDGTVLATETVRYGYPAQAPAVPERRGYTFSGWSEAFKYVYDDLTVAAQYEIKQYTVKYYDYDGEAMIYTDKIQFDQPISGNTAKGRLSKKTGYTFAGWRVIDADAESNMDIEHVDSDLSVVAVCKWENENLPIVITDLSAKRNAQATAYDVNFKLSCAESDLEILNGTEICGIKLITTLKTAQDKIVALSVDSVTVEAGALDQNKSVTVTLGNAKKSTAASWVEVYALALDGADRTGGTLSACTRAAVTPPDESWGEWTATEPSSGATKESRTVYYYQDIKTETTTVTSWGAPQKQYGDWKYVGSDIPLKLGSPYYNTWSAYSDASATKIYDNTADGTKVIVKKVQTQTVTVSDAYTEYRYGRWTNGSSFSFCPAVGRNNHGGTNWWITYSDWSRSQYTRFGSPHIHYCNGTCTSYTHQHVNKAYYDSSDGTDCWYVYCPTSTYTDSNKWFWEESRYVPAVTKTQYRYQLAKYINTFQKTTNGDVYMSVEKLEETDERKFVRQEEQWRQTVNIETEDNSGTPGNIASGTLAVDNDLSGKKAVFLVYKTMNTDPTESQLEYVKEIELQSGNTYPAVHDILFKEDVSARTGDFTVALAIEGYNNLINIAQIQYDRDDDTQSVVTIEPEQSYSVVFVDHANETVNLQTGIIGGSELILPDQLTATGKTFKGWSIAAVDADAEIPAIEDGAVIVDGNLVFIAQWEKETYTVDFLNEDGTIAVSRNVPYGDAAIPPESIAVSEGKVFLGWSDDVNWWDVTEALTVKPIVVYEVTAGVPTANLPAVSYGTESTLVLEAEPDATIYYYIVDEGNNGSGSEKGELSLQEYTGPISLTETTTIRAFAKENEKNDSEFIEVSFVYDDSAEQPVEQEKAEIGTYTVIAEAGKDVTLEVQIPENPGLLAYQFFIECDRSVFYLDCDENGNYMCTPGNVSENGTMIVAPYLKRGWQALWFASDESTDTGTLFSIALHTSDGIESGAYSIKVSYSPVNTITSEFEAAAMEQTSVLLNTDDSILLGDVNGDGQITMLDVVRIAKYVINDYTFTASQLAAADVTGDGKVTAADVVRLARYIVGLAELG